MPSTRDPWLLFVASWTRGGQVLSLPSNRGLFPDASGFKGVNRMSTSKQWKPLQCRKRTFYLAGLVIFIACSHASAAGTNEFKSPSELKQLSLEELTNQEVAIVTRRPEKVSKSPSAVQVITAQDIQRSGASSLPEALRLAPNLEVAQINSHNWAITARGFNQPGGTPNKLLVMIDGRTVYTPLFAGVFWDIQNVLLDDIDRIEVVSGPGGTLWGANAVNGVINIVRKSARETQGLLVEGAGGSFLQDLGAIRYGGNAGSNFFFRVYGQRFDRNSTVLPNGADGTNAWDMTQGGFRMDWYSSEANTVTFQSDIYSGSEEQPAPGDVTLDGENVLGRWTHQLYEGSDLSVQTYFDRTWRHVPTVFAEDLKTYDLDFQYRFPIGERHSFVWGGGYRLMQDSVRNSPVLAFLPADKNLQVFSGFLQDEITLIPERLKLTIGTKAEHNDYTGFELQPSGRLAWTFTDRQMVWAAISRAVRTPSRIDRNAYIPGVPPFFLAGGTNFDSEKLLAYELGYRVRPVDRVSLSLAAFYNQYDDIRSAETNGTSLLIKNGLQAQSWGLELSGEVQPFDWWRLRGGYTYLHKDVWEKPGHVDANNTHAEGNDPNHQFLLQSMMNLPANFQFDLVACYEGALPQPYVPGYFTFDARLAWELRTNLELAVIGQNLCDNRHPEFGSPATRQEIPRSLIGKITWRF